MPFNLNSEFKAKSKSSIKCESKSFPVDIVYTWVNQADKAWIQKRENAISGLNDMKNQCLCRDGIREKEFESLETLKFSMRSVSRYAGFARKIFIITDDQMPAWLNTDHEKIELVSHRQIFGRSGKLPCFNSHAIESRLHRIPGLAEHFLYLNDDFFLGRTLTARDFFYNREVSIYFPSPIIIDSSHVSEKDMAISSAAKQGQALLQNRFGKKPSHRIIHAPYPIRRSILFEMENTFPKEFASTASHPFRHQKDQSIAAFLYFYYARFTSRAIPGKINFMCLDNRMQQFLQKAIFTLIARRYHAFCINGGHTSLESNGIKMTMLRIFLRLCFPKKCEFEL